jgi:hypothetical protein
MPDLVLLTVRMVSNERDAERLFVEMREYLNKDFIWKVEDEWLRRR